MGPTIIEEKDLDALQQNDILMENEGERKLQKQEIWLSNNNVPDLFEKGKLLVHYTGIHWVCAMVNLNEKTISVYDFLFESGVTPSIGQVKLVRFFH
ncbi:10677_t:CDS:2 [Ambispora leptoticha]|uniref:10677_t:CDS:1 n=1 Tax=Ambispora leptoticha TaxID=144679 RepID=A0A9N9FJ76_9GLOM|nr:10677_t:CDS:2 [Ambispora leptoticha]